MKVISSIKKDLEFNKNLSDLIETLKTIAVAQYRTLEKKTKTFKEFLLTVKSFFDFIDIKTIKHPLLNPREKAQIIVVVTSDSGFLGGLNMQLVNSAISELEKTSGKLIVIGERGKIYLRGIGIPCVYFHGINDVERYGQAMQLRDYMMEEFLSGSFGYLKVVYPRPISFTVQRVETVTLLPYTQPAGQKAEQGTVSEVIMESTFQDAVEYLTYLWMGEELYEIFGLSRLAEFAARYMHLEESAQKLKDIDKKTRLEYFRVRHELVDRTMRELFAGRLLYGRK